MRVVQAAQVTTIDELREKVAAAQEGITASEAGAVRICQLLQNALDDCQWRPSDGHGESAIPVPRVEENIVAQGMAKTERPNDVDHHREKPAVYGLKGTRCRSCWRTLRWHWARRRSN
eukprot:jgi/Undpi1/4416/HiC_scaffold_17.g07771.m1